jgi:hypothetical protein
MEHRDLLLLVLKSNPTPQQTEVFGEQLAMLELGHVERLSTSVVRHAEAIARAKGLLPPLDEKEERRKQNRSLRYDDYSDKLTPGTAFAEQLTERYRKRIHTGVQAKIGIVDPKEDREFVQRCLAAVERKGAA